MKIAANLMHYKELNDLVRQSSDSEITIDNCTGQRFICAGLNGKKVTINGTPGNALGCYLDGCDVYVHGNTQEATGDTMNKGNIYVYGNAGDATGYAMRGGKIFIKGNSGYRTGIHMKSYKENFPVIVIGGAAGSFLGEYQAGGIIIVLKMNTDSKNIVGNFCGTGMHGGKIFLRAKPEELPHNLPKQVVAKKATQKDLKEILPFIEEYSYVFNENKENILNHEFTVLVPDTKNPYKQLYTHC